MVSSMSQNKTLSRIPLMDVISLEERAKASYLKFQRFDYYGELRKLLESYGVKIKDSPETFRGWTPDGDYTIRRNYELDTIDWILHE